MCWPSPGRPPPMRQHFTYSLRREQFGRLLARFQLIQDKLAHMLSDITGMQLMCTRMSQLQARGRVSIEHAALAKLNMVTGARRVLEVTDSVQVINRGSTKVRFHRPYPGARLWRWWSLSNTSPPASPCAGVLCSPSPVQRR